MIKITKEKDKYSIEYIDHFNHFDYLENMNYKSKSAKEEIIRERIKEVKNKLEKLIGKVRASSVKKH
jgi:hypothetical protein